MFVLRKVSAWEKLQRGELDSRGRKSARDAITKVCVWTIVLSVVRLTGKQKAHAKNIQAVHHVVEELQKRSVEVHEKETIGM